MAAKKKRGRQGVVSWVTSLVALLLGLGPAFVRLGAWFGGQHTFPWVSSQLNKLYNPLAGVRGALMEG